MLFLLSQGDYISICPFIYFSSTINYILLPRRGLGKDEIVYLKKYKFTVEDKKVKKQIKKISSKYVD